jgi:hypothetical protein
MKKKIKELLFSHEDGGNTLLQNISEFTVLLLLVPSAFFIGLCLGQPQFCLWFYMGVKPGL